MNYIILQILFLVRIKSLKSVNKSLKKAIEKIVTFFHTMEMDTKFYDYTPEYKKSDDFIVKCFEERGWIAMGEKQNITPDKIKEIIEVSY